MGQESKSKEQEQPQHELRSSTEELHKRAKDVLDRANQLLKETGKPKASETRGQGDTTQ